METAVILGAGQMGRAAAAAMNENGAVLMAFGDNTRRGEISGVAVMSIEDAIGLKPDMAIIAVAGEERARDLERQATGCGFGGRIVKLPELMKYVDIRKAAFLRLVRRLAGIDGAVAELGVYRGDFAAVIQKSFPDRKLYLFDTFEGFDPKDTEKEASGGLSKAKPGDFKDTSSDAVRRRLGGKAIIRKGYFPETCAGIDDMFAFVSLDADLFEPTLAGLEWFYERMVPGGAILLHDWDNPRFGGVAAAVDEYEKRHGILPLVPIGDMHGSAVVIKR